MSWSSMHGASKAKASGALVACGVKAPRSASPLFWRARHRQHCWRRLLARGPGGAANETTFAAAVRPRLRAPGVAVIDEQDVLGDRLVRRSRAKTGSDVLTEVSSLAVGDLVVHADHGIGRFVGVATTPLPASRMIASRCIYRRGGDKLYLPAENLEMLTTCAPGSSEDLGGVGWQSRKARLEEAHPRHRLSSRRSSSRSPPCANSARRR